MSALPSITDAGPIHTSPAIAIARRWRLKQEIVPSAKQAVHVRLGKGATPRLLHHHPLGVLPFVTCSIKVHSVFPSLPPRTERRFFSLVAVGVPLSSGRMVT